ncbi:xylulokinase [Sinomonas sp. G460-2]|uniref:xylulokinase n=1 Tax=Sinomonas sp. G460-2 TaxID=3393464 RepID=UPI0039F11FEE
MTDYLLGVDVGTSAIKAAIFDAHGAEIGSHAEEYSLLTAAAGHVELEVDTYTSTFALAVRRAIASSGVSPREIRALGLSCQGETFLCLDEEAQPLRRAIVWMDNRATAEAEEIEQRFTRPTLQEVTGQVGMDAIWPASKILWLRKNEPDMFERTAKFALLKDFLVQQLTGTLASEDSLLCTTMLFDIRQRKYWPDMLEYLGITEQQLPEIKEQGEIVGTLTASAAAELGLPEGVPVSVGALDQACGALGVGNAIPGIFSESTGSALATVTITEDIVVDPSGEVPCFPAAIPGQFMVHMFSTGGMVMRWYRDQFCADELKVAELCGKSAYTLIDFEVSQVRPGADDLIVLPHLQSAGPPDTDAYARGVIFGLTLAHTKQHVARGIMEGVAIVLRRMIEAASRLGVEVGEIISLSGGSKSDVWCQIKADATHLPIRTLLATESAASRGAAILAGGAAGVCASVIDVSRSSMHYDREFKPNKDNADVYDRLFTRYEALQQAVTPLFRLGQQP